VYRDVVAATYRCGVYSDGAAVKKMSRLTNKLQFETCPK